MMLFNSLNILGDVEITGNVREWYSVIHDHLYEILFVLAVLVFFVILYKLWNGIIKDKQKQIDELAKENRTYREMFLKLMNEKFPKLVDKQKKKEKK